MNLSSAQGSATVCRVYNSSAHDDPNIVYIDLQEEDISINYVRVVSFCEEFYIGHFVDDGEFETSDHVDEFCLLEEPALSSSSSTSPSMSSPVCFGLENDEVEETRFFCKMEMGNTSWCPTSSKYFVNYVNVIFRVRATTSSIHC